MNMMMYLRIRGLELRCIALLAANIVMFAALANRVAAEPKQLLRLKDGSFTVGQVVPSSHENRVGWRTDGFNANFHFDVSAIRSISRIIAEDAPDAVLPDGQLFELSEGGMLAGKLLELNDEFVLVESDLLGTIEIERTQLLSFSDAGYMGELVYGGPLKANTWKAVSDSEDWEFEAGMLKANAQGATVVGNVQMPSKSQINLVLSWKGVADFVFSFGTQSELVISPSEQIPAAARLEVWDKQLALVREVPGNADIALLSDISGVNSRVELTLFIDQDLGIVTVCDSHGRPLETITARASSPTVRSAVHLVNSGPALTIERFEVRHWDGHSTGAAGRDKGYVLGKDGQSITGVVAGYEPETQQVLLQTADGELATYPLASIRRADVLRIASTRSTKLSDSNRAIPPPVEQPPTPEQGEKSGEAEPVVEPNHGPSESQVMIETVFTDRSRFRGRWLTAQDGRLRCAIDGVTSRTHNGPLSFAPGDILGWVGTNDRHVNEMGNEKSGVLKIGDSQLAGYLDESSPDMTTTGLHWRPYSSLNSSEISDEMSGAIVYRRSIPKSTALNKLRPQTEEAAEAGSADELQGAHEVLFRTGDAIDAVVDSVDAQGMIFRSSQTSTTFAAHEEVHSVCLNEPGPVGETSKDKLQRLMTVPRSMKNDPPTHLLISVSGDYLRGRLISIDREKIVFGVRLEVVEVSRAEVAKVVWLHDRNWEEPSKKSATETDDNKATPFADGKFRVHTVGVDDRGLTFVPKGMVKRTLSGQSRLLGDCSVNLDEVTQLIFGRNIGEKIREFNDDPWTLSLAQYPKVFLQAGDAMDPNAGTLSELVGQPAPEFMLDTIDGELFQLREHHDRVVVLDFWASWCGPCVQSMPLVESAVAEMGESRVQLVAVNLQETANRVAAAVEKLKLNSTVLLDVNGEVASLYNANAIPQTVIIDRSGNVTHVFVGGGPRLVAELKEALRSVLSN